MKKTSSIQFFLIDTEIPLLQSSLILLPSHMTSESSLKISDEFVDNVVADLLKVTQNSGPEEDLGVADPVTILVDRRAQDDLGHLLVIIHADLKSNFLMK